MIEFFSGVFCLCIKVTRVYPKSEKFVADNPYFTIFFHHNNYKQTCNDNFDNFVTNITSLSNVQCICISFILSVYIYL